MDFFQIGEFFMPKKFKFVLDIVGLMKVSPKNYLVIRNPKDAVFIDETISMPSL